MSGSTIPAILWNIAAGASCDGIVPLPLNGTVPARRVRWPVAAHIRVYRILCVRIDLSVDRFVLEAGCVRELNGRSGFDQWLMLHIPMRIVLLPAQRHADPVTGMNNRVDAV